MTAHDQTCDNCNGYGEVTAGDPDIGQPERPQVCAKCEGTGVSGCSTDTPADAEEGLSTWIDEVERNHIQNERDIEESEWAHNEALQAETDDAGDAFL